MIKKLVDNYENCIKYTRYYIVIVSILFLIFGHGDDNNNEILQIMLQRVIIVGFICLGHVVFYNMPKFILRINKKALQRNEKIKKFYDSCMNFSIIFFTFGVVITSINLFTSAFAFILLGYVLPLGVILGALRVKKYFIYN